MNHEQEKASKMNDWDLREKNRTTMFAFDFSSSLNFSLLYMTSEAYVSIISTFHHSPMLLWQESVWEDGIICSRLSSIDRIWKCIIDNQCGKNMFDITLRKLNNTFLGQIEWERRERRKIHRHWNDSTRHGHGSIVSFNSSITGFSCIFLHQKRQVSVDSSVKTNMNLFSRTFFSLFFSPFHILNCSRFDCHRLWLVLYRFILCLQLPSMIYAGNKSINTNSYVASLSLSCWYIPKAAGEKSKKNQWKSVTNTRRIYQELFAMNWKFWKWE